MATPNGKLYQSLLSLLPASSQSLPVSSLLSLSLPGFRLQLSCVQLYLQIISDLPTLTLLSEPYEHLVRAYVYLDKSDPKSAVFHLVQPGVQVQDQELVQSSLGEFRKRYDTLRSCVDWLGDEGCSVQRVDIQNVSDSQMMLLLALPDEDVSPSLFCDPNATPHEQRIQQSVYQKFLQTRETINPSTFAGLTKDAPVASTSHAVNAAADDEELMDIFEGTAPETSAVTTKPLTPARDFNQKVSRASPFSSQYIPQRSAGSPYINLTPSRSTATSNTPSKMGSLTPSRLSTPMNRTQTPESHLTATNSPLRQKPSFKPPPSAARNTVTRTTRTRNSMASGPAVGRTPRAPPSAKKEINETPAPVRRSRRLSALPR